MSKPSHQPNLFLVDLSGKIPIHIHGTRSRVLNVPVLLTVFSCPLLCPGVPPERPGRKSCWHVSQIRSVTQSQSQPTPLKPITPVAAASLSSISSVSTCSVPSWWVCSSNWNLSSVRLCTVEEWSQQGKVSLWGLSHPLSDNTPLVSAIPASLPLCGMLCGMLCFQTKSFVHGKGSTPSSSMRKPN